jgi:DNA-binding transcriptional LysR family regulator
MRSPRLRALQPVEVTGRHLGVSAAAQELNTTASAVCRQLTALERQLGVGLLHREIRAGRIVPLLPPTAA